MVTVKKHERLGKMSGAFSFELLPDRTHTLSCPISMQPDGSAWMAERHPCVGGRGAVSHGCCCLARTDQLGRPEGRD